MFHLYLSTILSLHLNILHRCRLFFALFFYSCQSVNVSNFPTLTRHPISPKQQPVHHKWKEFHLPYSTTHYTCIKKSLRIIPSHLTPKFELRKSCWEICDSQRVWKSQFSDVFVRNSLVFAKQHVVCDKTTWCSWDFKGLFSDYVPRNLYFFPRNLFFFPRDFENVRRNSISEGRNRGILRENRRIIPKRRGKPKRFSKRNWRREKKQRIAFSRRQQNLVKNDLPF